MEEPVWIEKREVLTGSSWPSTAAPMVEGRDPARFGCREAIERLRVQRRPRYFTLAASYVFGIARNDAFIDGNKRTAAAISMGFLILNGFDIEASKAFLHLADGSLSEEEMAVRFRRYAVAK